MQLFTVIIEPIKGAVKRETFMRATRPELLYLSMSRSCQIFCQSERTEETNSNKMESLTKNKPVLLRSVSLQDCIESCGFTFLNRQMLLLASF